MRVYDRRFSTNSSPNNWDIPSRIHLPHALSGIVSSPYLLPRISVSTTVPADTRCVLPRSSGFHRPEGIVVRERDEVHDQQNGTRNNRNDPLQDSTRQSPPVDIVLLVPPPSLDLFHRWHIVPLMMIRDHDAINRLNSPWI